MDSEFPSLFQIIWTAFWIFVVSMVSQKEVVTTKSSKDRIAFALAMAVIFTMLTLGVVILPGSE